MEYDIDKVILFVVSFCIHFTGTQQWLALHFTGWSLASQHISSFLIQVLLCCSVVGYLWQGKEVATLFYIQQIKSVVICWFVKSVCWRLLLFQVKCKMFMKVCIFLYFAGNSCLGGLFGSILASVGGGRSLQWRPNTEVATGDAGIINLNPFSPRVVQNLCRVNQVRI